MIVEQNSIQYQISKEVEPRTDHSQDIAIINKKLDLIIALISSSKNPSVSIPIVNRKYIVISNILPKNIMEYSELYRFRVANLSKVDLWIENDIPCSKVIESEFHHGEIKLGKTLRSYLVDIVENHTTGVSIDSLSTKYNVYRNTVSSGITRLRMKLGIRNKNRYWYIVTHETKNQNVKYFVKSGIRFCLIKQNI
ncbi:MAG: hypothetical protein WC955_05080 [Elusimicrobiota bacterium]